MSVVTLLLPPSHGRGMPEGQGVGQSRKRAKPRNLSCTPDITTGVLGGRLNTSRFSSSNTQHFPACKGDPSAALGMTVLGSSLSVSLGTFDLSASRILIKEVRICAHHLIEERQYPWSLIPNPCFQISRFGGERFSCIVISSEAEKSFLHTGYHDWCPWRQAQYFSFLVIKHPAFSCLQGGSLGCARDDGAGKQPQRFPNP